MSKKKIAEDLYVKYYNEIKPMIGTKTTHTGQLNKLGKKLFGKRFRGAWPSDHTPKLKKGQSMIINVDKKDEPGSHWLSVVRDRNSMYVYDSFGRHTKNLIPHFYKKNGSGSKVKNTERDIEQRNEQLDCGLRCMSSLAVYYDKGINYFKMI